MYAVERSADRIDSDIKFFGHLDGYKEVDVVQMLQDAVSSIPDNLAEIGGQLTDPLGLDLGDLSDTTAQAEQQDVQINTISAMQNLFDGQAGAFAYLLFILLYMPCVATIGVIYKEIGSFWGNFSVTWSFVMAYGCAVIAYQVGTFGDHPLSSAAGIAATCLVATGLFSLLILWGKKSPGAKLIPLKVIE